MALRRSVVTTGQCLNRHKKVTSLILTNKSKICTTSHLRSDASATKPKLTYSYSHVCEGVPLTDLTVSGALQQTVEKFPDRECFVFCEEGIRRTFSQFSEEVDRLAAGFLKLGLKKGDRVGIWGPSTLEWVLTQFATGRAGIILVNINPAYQVKELEYALRLVGCKAIVSASKFKTQDYYSMIREVAPEIESCGPGKLKSKKLPDLSTVIMMGNTPYPGTFKFDDVMQIGGSAEINEIHNLQKKLQFDDPINIQFTSGTTGHPKGATLSHHNIINNAVLIGRRVNYHNEYHRILCQVPLYHCYGMVAGTLCAAVHGVASIFPVPGYDPAATAKALKEEKCTVVYGTPTMYIDLLSQVENTDYKVPLLTRGIMAGSPCPVEVITKVEQVFNLRLQVLYIQGNSLSDLLPDTFIGLSSVEKLELQNNGIEKLHPRCFTDLGYVTYVNLNLNRITSLGPFTFSGLSNLEDLNLQQNNISSISPLAFQGLERLKALNLKLNHLSSIPTKALKVLPKLSSLYAGKNPIVQIKRGDLKGLRSLRHLYLEECEIQRIAKRAFNDKNIYTLALERNLLTSFPNLGRMTQLMVLKLDDNPWKCDSQAIPMLRWLLHHDIVDVTVICYTPEYRRGHNLMIYSIEDLIKGTGVRNPDLTTLRTLMTTNQKTSLDVINPSTTFLTVSENQEVVSTKDLANSSASPDTTFVTQSHAAFQTALPQFVSDRPFMTSQRDVSVQNTTSFAEDESSGNNVTLTIADESSQEIVTHRVTAVEEYVQSTTSQVAIATEKSDTRVSQSINIIVIVLSMIACMVVVACVIRKIKMRQRIEKHRRYLFRGDHIKAISTNATHDNGIRMHCHGNGKRPSFDLNKVDESKVTSLPNDCTMTSLDDVNKVLSDDVKIIVDANGNSPTS